MIVEDYTLIKSVEAKMKIIDFEFTRYLEEGLTQVY